MDTIPDVPLLTEDDTAIGPDNPADMSEQQATSATDPNALANPAVDYNAIRDTKYALARDLRRVMRQPLKRQPLAFLDLAGEIRNKIYNILLHPDLYGCKEDYPYWCNTVGCTKVLVLCRQTYAEAITTLQARQATLSTSMQGKAHSFRHPLANGKPNIFRSHTFTSQVQMLDGLTELEFINLRQVFVYIKYSDDSRSQTDFRNLIIAVSKSDQLQRLHVKIQASTPDGVDKTRVTIIERWFLPLIQACIAKCVILTAEVDNMWENERYNSSSSKHWEHEEGYSDPLVQLIDDHKQLQVANKALLKLPKDKRSSGPQTNHDSSYPSYEKSFHHSCSSYMHGNTGVSSTEEVYDGPQGNSSVFRLKPECRQCYRVFLSEQALRKHLTDIPQHRTRFVRKAYNDNIHHLATAGGNRTCVVCGRSYVSEVMLEKHIGQERHGWRDRQLGPLPRFAKDNKWFRN